MTGTASRITTRAAIRRQNRAHDEWNRKRVRDSEWAFIQVCKLAFLTAAYLIGHGTGGLIVETAIRLI